MPPLQGPEPDDAGRRAGAAYVQLRGLSPRGVSRVKWWSALARELRKLARSGDLAPRAAWSAARGARAGFLPTHGALYALDARAGEYLSDRQRELTWTIDWPAAGLLDDKLAFFFMMRQLGVPTPEVSGIAMRGRLMPLGVQADDADPSAWFARRLRERGRLIVRPTRSGGGAGLWIVESDGHGFRVNGETLDAAEFARRSRDLHDHLVTDFVAQGAYAQRIFPGATNTIRAITMHGDDGRPFIAGAIHRFGTARSAPADNFSQGGLSVRVDLERGTLGRGASRPRPGELEWHERHPDTGEQLVGTQVPNWPTVHAGLLEAARRTPFLPYVAWDVIIADDGYSIIEGNKFSGVVALQVHEPLLSDPRVRAFYAAHGIA